MNDDYISFIKLFYFGDLLIVKCAFIFQVYRCFVKTILQIYTLNYNLKVLNIVKIENF